MNLQARSLRHIYGFGLDWALGKRHAGKLIMNKRGLAKSIFLIPGALGLLALVAFAFWFTPATATGAWLVIVTMYVSFCPTWIGSVTSTISSRKNGLPPARGNRSAHT